MMATATPNPVRISVHFSSKSRSRSKIAQMWQLNSTFFDLYAHFMYFPRHFDHAQGVMRLQIRHGLSENAAPRNATESHLHREQPFARSILSKPY